MTELERQLRELGAEVAYPSTPDIAAAVMARVGAGRQPLLASRRVLALGLAIATVAIGAVMAVPQARTAILDWLGVGGVEIRLVDELPEILRAQRCRLVSAPRSSAWAGRPATGS